MNDYERQRQLLDRALEHLADSAMPLSKVLEDCIRLARLRMDYTNLWWLRIESLGLEDKREMAALEAEMAQAFDQVVREPLRQRLLLDYMERRRITGENAEPLVSAESLAEVEASLATLEDLVESSRPSPGLHPQDLYFATESHQKVRAKTLRGSTAVVWFWGVSGRSS